jgi:integrase/recombinase XerD
MEPFLDYSTQGGIMETALARIGYVDSLATAGSYRDSYSGQFRHFVKWARETDHGLDEDGVRAYFLALEGMGYAAATIAVKRASVKRRIRQVYHDASTDDRMKIDRVLYDLDHDIRTPKINSNQVTRDKVLSGLELSDLIAHCRSDRQRLYIRFLAATGCRVAELCGIRLDQCEEQGEAVKIRIMGKGKKERRLRVPMALYAEIRATFHGSIWLFETSGGKASMRGYVSSQVAIIGKRIGKKISAHTLRHTFATFKVNQLPGKLDAISRYLGHSSTAITLNMYVHSSLSDDELFAEIAS